MIVRITVSQDVIAKARQFPVRALQAMRRGIDMGLELALARATADRFTGRGPYPVSAKRLGVVTGRLRQTLRRTPAVISGGRITATIGSNVRYFGAHEFGFAGSVQVRAHSRTRSSEGGQPISNAAASRVRSKKRTITQSTHTVRAHSRRVNIPERMPMRTGIRENIRMVADAVNAQLRAEWER